MGKEQLALLGGDKSVTEDASDIFTWPIVTERHERAVLEVLRNRQMSGNEITKEFEKKYASMLGRKHGLAYPNGTSAILGAMYGLGIGLGDEVICPSITYWASIAQAEHEGRPYWQLQGSMSRGNGMAFTTICYDDPADTDWAVAVFRSLFHPPAEDEE